MERDSPKHATVTKLKYAVLLNPWISLLGTHFAKPIKLANMHSAREESIHPPILLYFRKK